MESHGAIPTTFTFASNTGWHDLDEATSKVHSRALALQSKQRADRLSRETTALLSMLDASQAERLTRRKIERQQRREARRISAEAQAAAKQFAIDEAKDREALIKLRNEHVDRTNDQHGLDLRDRSDQMMPSQEQIIDLRADDSRFVATPDEVAKRERSALIDLRNRHGKSSNGAVPILREAQPRSAASTYRWG